MHSTRKVAAALLPTPSTTAHGLTAAAFFAGLGGLGQGIEPELVSLASNTGLTGERMMAMVAAVTALVGVLVGGLSLYRARHTGPAASESTGGVVALAAGLGSAILGVVVILTADGGPGTGNGLVGGYVAVILAMICLTLGWLTIFRARRLQTKSELDRQR